MMIHSLGGINERMTRVDFHVDTRVNRACDFQKKETAVS